MQGGGKGSNFLRDPSSRKTGKYKFARRLKVCRRRGGGVIVVHRGPKGIIVPGAPYFTELVRAAPVFLRRGESSVFSFDLCQLALKPQELLTSDQGLINVARGPWQILARGPQTSPFLHFMKTIEFKDTQKC
jgi:hypothetical protein